MRSILKAKFLCGSLFLMACGGSDPGTDANGSFGSSPESAAPDAPVAVAPAGDPSVVDAARAEATAVGHALSMGWLDRQTAARSHVGSLAAVDFEGAPSFHLVFIARSASVSAPLTFAAANTASLRERGAGSFAMVGATEDQSEVGAYADSLSTLDDVRLTVTAMGGAAQLDAIVAPAAGVLLLRDKSGTHWDVSKHTPVDAAVIEARRQEYRAATAADEGGERTNARALWQSHRLDDAGAITLESVSANGHLDLQRALAATLAFDSLEMLPVRTPSYFERQGALTERRECKRFLFFKSCEDIEEGELSNPAQTQAHLPVQPEGFTANRCVAGAFRADDDNASLGCGPAAVVGAIWTSWRNGAYFSSLANESREDLEAYDRPGLSARYEAFSRLIGQDLMDRMDTCSFGANGSATLPGGLLDGTNTWLAANGSHQRMQMVRGSGNRNEKAGILHARLGVGEQPIIVGFDITVTVGGQEYGFGNSHWAPVTRYRIVRGHGPLNRTQVFIQYLGQDADAEGKWYELFGIKLLKALAWLEGPTGTEPASGDGRPSRN